LDASSFEVIDREVDRSPSVVQWFGLVSGAHVSQEPTLHRAQFGIGALRFDERRRIGATAVVRPSQLDRVVLPEADGTDLIATRDSVERDMPTARARIALFRSVHDASGSIPLRLVN